MDDSRKALVKKHFYDIFAGKINDVEDIIDQVLKSCCYNEEQAMQRLLDIMGVGCEAYSSSCTSSSVDPEHDVCLEKQKAQTSNAAAAAASDYKTPREGTDSEIDGSNITRQTKLHTFYSLPSSNTDDEEEDRAVKIPNRVFYSFHKSSLSEDHEAQETSCFANEAVESTTEDFRSSYHKEGKFWLLLMRGLPGSGKTTEAEKISRGRGFVVSPKQYFEEGGLQYDVNKLEKARDWVKCKVTTAIQERQSPIIVDDLHIHAWELKPFVEMAQSSHLYDSKIIEPANSWAFDPKVLSKKNTLRIGEAEIRQMLKNYKDLTIASILNTQRSFNEIQNGASNSASLVEIGDNNEGSSMSERQFSPDGSVRKRTTEVVYNETPLEYIRNYQDSRKKWMILMRGLPGSGKSKKAVLLAGKKGVILSSNDYFLDYNGRYEFKKSKIREAHNWNQNRAREAIGKGVSPIIVDNTNMELWEMKVYAVVAREYGYDVAIIEPDTPWKKDVNMLEKKNIHGVDKEVIKRMKHKYQENVTLDLILESISKAPGNYPAEVEDSEDVFLTASSSTLLKTESNRYQDQSKLYMILMRGLPGCGKTFKARELCGTKGKIFSSSDFFLNADGKYVFNKKKIEDSHTWNQNRAFEALSHGISPVFIDNTNCKAWEMKVYVEKALKHKYDVEILEPDTAWAWDVKKLAEKNVHDLNDKVIYRMKNNYEKDVTVEKILKSSKN